MAQTTKARLRVFVLCILWSAAVSDLFAADIVFVWDPNPASDNVIGYRLYYGTTRPLTLFKDAGRATTYTFSTTGLASGNYIFALTAYNASGESAFSNEIPLIIAATTSRCDLNGDGKIDVVDHQTLINILQRLAPCPGNCDLSGDGKVDIVDVQMLANIVNGLASCPP